MRSVVNDQRRWTATLAQAVLEVTPDVARTADARLRSVGGIDSLRAEYAEDVRHAIQRGDAARATAKLLALDLWAIEIGRRVGGARGWLHAAMTALLEGASTPQSTIVEVDATPVARELTEAPDVARELPVQAVPVVRRPAKSAPASTIPVIRRAPRGGT